jgi:hypothetical protein
MARKTALFAIMVLLGALGFSCASNMASAQTCAMLDLVKDKGNDATPVITECLKNLPRKGVLKLPPGKYQLLTPMVINRSVTIETAPTSAGLTCLKDTGAYCAVLAIGQMPPQSTAGAMPIEVMAKNVVFHSIAIIGQGNHNLLWQQRICLDQHARPLGGGVRVQADGFEMTNVLLKDVSCYAAMEIIAGVNKARIIDNVIGPNGDHKDNKMWSDGVTIHDAYDLIVDRNVFIDNTDVQLILGGCRGCKIKNNKFSHSDAFIHASFAELMVHAWPGTSGNFSGSTTSGNNIDCGPYRRCGYGLMIGGEPWYPSKAFGGIVAGNYIKNALLGLNVDKLTGTMKITNNVVLNSGGPANSDCGFKSWPATNISPDSLIFIYPKVTEGTNINTHKCLLNRQE